MAEEVVADLAGEVDCVSWESCLDLADDMTLVESMKQVEGMTFYHGPSKQHKTFKISTFEPELVECVKWAEEEKIKDTELAKDLAHIPAQRQATGRAWTMNSCYPINSIMRKKGRSLTDTIPAQPYMKNFLGFLHALPEKFIFHGDLFRAEHGVRSNWNEKIIVGNTVECYEPRSYSYDPKVMDQFMATTGVRTLTVIKKGMGYLIEEISKYKGEKEVLTEGIMRLRITQSIKYDEEHPLVKVGQVQAGLHFMEAEQIEGGVQAFVYVAKLLVEAESEHDQAAELQAFSFISVYVGVVCFVIFGRGVQAMSVCRVCAQPLIACRHFGGQGLHHGVCHRGGGGVTSMSSRLSSRS